MMRKNIMNVNRTRPLLENLIKLNRLYRVNSNITDYERLRLKYMIYNAVLTEKLYFIDMGNGQLLSLPVAKNERLSQIIYGCDEYIPAFTLKEYFDKDSLGLRNSRYKQINLAEELHITTGYFLPVVINPFSDGEVCVLFYDEMVNELMPLAELICRAKARMEKQPISPGPLYALDDNGRICRVKYLLINRWRIAKRIGIKYWERDVKNHLWEFARWSSYDEEYLWENLAEEILYDEEKEEILGIRRDPGTWCSKDAVEKYKPSEQVERFLKEHNVTYEDIYGGCYKKAIYCDKLKDAYDSDSIDEICGNCEENSR